MLKRKLINRAHRIADLLYQQKRLIVFSLDPTFKRPRVPEDLPVIRQEAWTREDPLGQAVRLSGDWDDAEMGKRRQRGDVCYTVIADGKCVHYSWVSRTLFYSSEVDYKASLPANQCWIYNCYTAPSHRGKGIYAFVLGRITEEFFASGGVRAWIAALGNNTSSLRGISKAGFKETARIEKTTLFSAKTWRSQVGQIPQQGVQQGV